MTDTPLQRRRVQGHFRRASKEGTHAGLWLSKGLAKWTSDPSERGKSFQKHLQQVSKIPVSDLYQKAYQRWHDGLAANTDSASAWLGELETRMYIGMGGLSVIETNITLSRTYGVPVIPGSALKGLLRGYCDLLDLTDEETQILFGHPGQENDPGDAGYLIFHDAWWVPQANSFPLTPEVITVHHQDYYQSQGRTPATDFDAPNPNGQIAAQGSFLFSIECADKDWRQFAMQHLQGALKQFGIGGKTSSGYGRFCDDKKGNTQFTKARQQTIDLTLSPEDRLRAEVERLTPGQIALMLTKDKNKTKKTRGEDWETFVDLIREIHAPLWQDWRDSDKANERKAFKFLSP